MSDKTPGQSDQPSTHHEQPHDDLHQGAIHQSSTVHLVANLSSYSISSVSQHQSQIPPPKRHRSFQPPARLPHISSSSSSSTTTTTATIAAAPSSTPLSTSHPSIVPTLPLLHSFSSMSPNRTVAPPPQPPVSISQSPFATVPRKQRPMALPFPKLNSNSTIALVPLSQSQSSHDLRATLGAPTTPSSQSIENRRIRCPASVQPLTASDHNHVSHSPEQPSVLDEQKSTSGSILQNHHTSKTQNEDQSEHQTPQTHSIACQYVSCGQTSSIQDETDHLIESNLQFNSITTSTLVDQSHGNRPTSMHDSGPIDPQPTTANSNVSIPPRPSLPAPPPSEPPNTALPRSTNVPASIPPLNHLVDFTSSLSPSLFAGNKPLTVSHHRKSLSSSLALSAVSQMLADEHSLVETPQPSHNIPIGGATAATNDPLISTAHSNVNNPSIPSNIPNLTASLRPQHNPTSINPHLSHSNSFANNTMATPVIHTPNPTLYPRQIAPNRTQQYSSSGTHSTIGTDQHRGNSSIIIPATAPHDNFIRNSTVSSNGSGGSSSKRQSSRSGRQTRGSLRQQHQLLQQHSSAVEATRNSDSSGGGAAGIPATSQFIVAVGELRSGRHIGIAAIDIQHPEIILTQFTDTQTYAVTLAVLQSFDPKIILLPEVRQDNSLFESLLRFEFDLAQTIIIKRKFFNENSGLRYIERYCIPNSVLMSSSGNGSDDPNDLTNGPKTRSGYAPTSSAIDNAAIRLDASKYLCLACCGCLCQYIETVQQVLWAPHTLRLRFHRPDGMMYINMATLNALELVTSTCTSRYATVSSTTQSDSAVFFENVQNDSSDGQQPSAETINATFVRQAARARGQKNTTSPISSRPTTLFNAINHTYTKGGARLLRQSIVTPFHDLPSILARLHCVETILSNEDVFFRLGRVLPHFREVDSICAQFVRHSQTLTPHHALQRVMLVVHLYDILLLLPDLLDVCALCLSPAAVKAILQSIQDQQEKQHQLQKQQQQQQQQQEHDAANSHQLDNQAEYPRDISAYVHESEHQSSPSDISQSDQSPPTKPTNQLADQLSDVCSLHDDDPLIFMICQHLSSPILAHLITLIERHVVVERVSVLFKTKRQVHTNSNNNNDSSFNIASATEASTAAARVMAVSFVPSSPSSSGQSNGGGPCHNSFSFQPSLHTSVLSAVQWNINPELDQCRNEYFQVMQDIDVYCQGLLMNAEAVFSQPNHMNNNNTGTTTTTSSSSVRGGLAALQQRGGKILSWTAARGYHLSFPKALLPTTDLLADIFVQRVNKAKTVVCTTLVLEALNQRQAELFDDICVHTALTLQSLFAELHQSMLWVHLLADHIALLDLLLSFCTHITLHPGVFIRPHLTSDGPVIITQAKHPLALSDPSHIPNNILFTPQHPLLLLTGPNNCGKSTYLRQIGSIIVLAQIGCYVPAQYATMCIFHNLVTSMAPNIVSAQSCPGINLLHTALLSNTNTLSNTSGQLAAQQTESTSTFYTEMKQTAQVVSVLSSARVAFESHAVSSPPHTLVLIDEIGRSTSHLCGLSLACALCEFLATSALSRTATAARTPELAATEPILCFGVFATHFQELIQLTRIYAQIKHIAMAVQLIPPIPRYPVVRHGDIRHSSDQQPQFEQLAQLRFLFRIVEVLDATTTIPFGGEYNQLVARPDENHIEHYGLMIAQTAGIPSAILSYAQKTINRIEGTVAADDDITGNQNDHSKGATCSSRQPQHNHLIRSSNIVPAHIPSTHQSSPNVTSPSPLLTLKKRAMYQLLGKLLALGIVVKTLLKSQPNDNTNDQSQCSDSLSTMLCKMETPQILQFLEQSVSPHLMVSLAGLMVTFAASYQELLSNLTRRFSDSSTTALTNSNRDSV